MPFTSYKKRSVARQTGAVNFYYDVSLDNSTGSCVFGLSGTNALTFTASSGKLYDPSSKFVSSYATNQTFSISGQAKGAMLDYWINGKCVGLGVPISSGSYDWLIVSPTSCSAEFQASILGESPNYSMQTTGAYTAPNVQVSGAIINNTPERPFRIFSVTNSLTNSPFSVVGFTTGNITGTGYVVLTSTETGLNDYVVPLLLETNFGNVALNFDVSGDYTRTPSFYISYAPAISLVAAGTVEATDINFSYYPTGMPLAISLDYVSGTTGNIYADQTVSTGIEYRTLGGTVTGYAQLSQTQTGLITGTGAFGDSWTTTGSGVFTSDFVYTSGSVSKLWTGIVYGTGEGYIGTFNSLEIPAYAYITGRVTGDAVSGVFSYDFPISGVAIKYPSFSISGGPIGNSGIYSTRVSGYRTAAASVWIDELFEGDYLSLDGVITEYKAYDAVAPYSFNSMAGLIDILNTYPIFEVTAAQITGRTGEDVGTGAFGVPLMTGVGEPGVSGLMQLWGIRSGELGNVSIAASGGISISGSQVSLTGGKTFYYTLIPAVPDSIWYGRVAGSVSVAGYVTASGSGELSGTASMIDRVRTFTGTWGLQTGDRDYLTDGQVSGISSYQSAPVTFYDVVNSVSAQVAYNDDYMADSPDLALLTVTGVGTNSGVQFMLSGTY